MGPWPRRAWTRSRRSRCSTWRRGRSPTRSRRPGCPFHCSFCQNWEIAQAPRLGTTVPTRHLSPDSVVDAALDHDAASIAYTYVEPTVFLEFALDTARRARAAGLLNLFVTDGYATPEAIDLPGARA